MAEREPTARDLYVANLMEELDGDPETRGPLRDLVAKKFPKAAEMMPETHVKKALEPELAKLREEREALAKDRAAESQRRRRDELHARFRTLGVAAADIPSVEDFMVKNLTASPELAVMGWREAKKVATPGPSRSWGVSIPGAKDSGQFFAKSPYSGVSIADDWQRWRRERAEKDFADLEAGRPLDPVTA